MRSHTQSCSFHYVLFSALRRYTAKAKAARPIKPQRWTNLASLLASGTRACCQYRSAHHVSTNSVPNQGRSFCADSFIWRPNTMVYGLLVILSCVIDHEVMQCTTKAFTSPWSQTVNDFLGLPRNIPRALSSWKTAPKYQICDVVPSQKTQSESSCALRVTASRLS